mmetsp:Transcript_49621/g.73788  ORF Transcript_49621/g.73788 Transcript_49621/m.73788 type:complete len:504 (+) Transcript_49621:18-1529(+)
MSTTTAVLAASATSVGKVFLISLVGYLSTKYPKDAPWMPSSQIGMISRMTFYVLTIPLVYATMASTVSIGVLAYLWFVPVSAVVVITISYITATLLGYLPCLRVDDRDDFEALRIAGSFPNIVALPILIFPTLCEFDVVYDAFSVLDPSQSSPEERIHDCTAQATTMIFTYFFAWNVMFWCWGSHKLVSAGTKRQSETVVSSSNGSSPSISSEQQVRNEKHTSLSSYLNSIYNALKQVCTSAGFIAMVLGFITASIPPLQSALFSSGGALRFLGSAIESLADAAPSLNTLVVAASLNLTLPQTLSRSGASTDLEGEENGRAIVDAVDVRVGNETQATKADHNTVHNRSQGIITSAPNNSRRRRSSLQEITSEVSRRSIRMADAVRTSTFRTHAWFTLSRLILSPAIVCGILIAMDCSSSTTTNALSNIPPLAKLVVLINAALPGALLIVLILKSRDLGESAAVVAQVYFPSYLLSVVTITAWTSVGLTLSIPQENGFSFCGAQ